MGHGWWKLNRIKVREKRNMNTEAGWKFAERRGRRNKVDLGRRH